MSDENCFLEIAKLAGRDLSNTEKKEINDFIKNVVARAEKADLPGTLNQKVNQFIDTRVKDAEMQAIIQKRTAAINYKSRLDNKKKIQENFKDDYALGLESIIGEVRSAAEGGKDVLHANISAERQFQMMGLLSKLDKARVVDIASNKEFRQPLFEAMHELGSLKPNQELVSKMNPDIVEAAKILNESLELARTRFNKAGGFIGKQESYVMRQSHDQNKIAKAAGNTVKIGDNAHRQQWLKDISELLDFDKFYPELDMDAKLLKLNDDFEALSTGVHLKYGDTVSSFKGPSSIGKRYDKSRTMHFKDAKSAFKYWEKYGSGENIVENVLGQVNRMARDTSIMNKLGVNAENNLAQIVDDLKKDLKDKGRYAEIAALEDKYNNLMETTWPNITDGLSSSPDNLFAQFNSLARNFTYANTLGGAVLSQVSDFAFAGMAFRRVSTQDMGGYLNGVTGHVSRMLEGYSPTEKVQLSNQLGIMMDAHNILPSRYEADVSIPGKGSRFLELVNKANLVGWFQQKSRMAGVAF